ncbi:MAG: hypothetical protein V4591_12280 [Bdellovibrionota bacterium]
MQKIILIEDIVHVAVEIKSLLHTFDVKMFHNSRSFLHEYQSVLFKNFLSQTDFFILDFNLGDGTLISSCIYEIILENRKKDSILCCISSFGQQIIEKNCAEIAKKYQLTQPFDYYLKKNPEVIGQFILNMNKN